MRGNTNKIKRTLCHPELAARRQQAARLGSDLRREKIDVRSFFGAMGWPLHDIAQYCMVSGIKRRGR